MCSIFIASTTSTGRPALTACPTLTCTATTVPGMGERTVPSAAAARAPRSGASAAAATAHVCPFRPSQVVSPSAA